MGYICSHGYFYAQCEDCSSAIDILEMQEIWDDDDMENDFEMERQQNYWLDKDESELREDEFGDF